MRIAVFPGSFNPFTVGHKLIVDEALKIFDRVVICQFINSDKGPENIDIWRIRKLFSEDERRAFRPCLRLKSGGGLDWIPSGEALSETRRIGWGRG